MRPPLLNYNGPPPQHPLFFFGAVLIVSMNIVTALVTRFLPGAEALLRVFALILSIAISLGYIWRSWKKPRNRKRRSPQEPGRYLSRLPILLALALALSATSCAHLPAVVHEFAGDTNALALEVRTIYGSFTVYRNCYPRSIAPAPTQ